MIFETIHTANKTTQYFGRLRSDFGMISEQ